MSGSHVDGSETTITMELDSIDDIRDELDRKSNECKTKNKAMMRECNKDFFSTLSNCAQFNTSSFAEYDNQLQSVYNCVDTIINSINNYVGEQRVADVENEQELDSIEEPAVESETTEEQKAPATTTASTDKSLDSETLETKEQDKKELKDEPDGEKQALEDINSGKDRNQKTSEMEPSEVKEQEQLRDINNNNGEEQKTADDNYSKKEETLKNIKNDNSTEEVDAVIENSSDSLTQLKEFSFNEISDTDYSTFIDDLIRCANENRVTVDVLLSNISYSQKVKDMCSSSNISADFKISLVGEKEASVVQKDIYNSIFVDTVEGKRSAYLKLLENCSDSFKNGIYKG